jgi:endoglucanase
VSVIEGNNGNTVMTFEVTGISTIGTIDFATRDGSAIAGLDYVAISGTVSNSNRMISIDILGDRVEEADEVFEIVLSNPTNAVILNNLGEGVIVNDDFNIFRDGFE